MSQYYYKIMGQPVGPVNSTQLRQLAAAGTIQLDTPISVDRKRWCPASEVRGLFTEPTPPPRAEEIPDEEYTFAPQEESPQKEFYQEAISTQPVPQPVPRSYAYLRRKPTLSLNSIIWFFDFKFERYLTPKIIRMFWLLCLLSSIAGVAYVTLMFLPQAMPSTREYVPRSYDVRQKISMLEEMILEKEYQERKRPERSERPEPRPQVTQELTEEPQEDPAEQYARMNLNELKAELKKLNDENPEYRTRTDFRRTLMYILAIALQCFAAIISLLIVRVACEMIIVIFNIAKTLIDIRDRLNPTN